jgi:hypothetical protein
MCMLVGLSSCADSHISCISQAAIGTVDPHHHLLCCCCCCVRVYVVCAAVDAGLVTRLCLVRVAACLC